MRRLQAVLPGAFTSMRKDAERGLIALWSGYAFGQWPTEDAYAWHRANDTTGVSRIIHADGDQRPMRVYPRGLVDAWIATADGDGVVPGLKAERPRPAFAGLVGKTVLVREGLLGRVCRVDDRGWAIVGAELLGRPHMVSRPAIELRVLEGEAWEPRFTRWLSRSQRRRSAG